jgi:hypothetical protein
MLTRARVQPIDLGLCSSPHCSHQRTAIMIFISVRSRRVNQIMIRRGKPQTASANVASRKSFAVTRRATAQRANAPDPLLLRTCLLVRPQLHLAPPSPIKTASYMTCCFQSRCFIVPYTHNEVAPLAPSAVKTRFRLVGCFTCPSMDV